MLYSIYQFTEYRPYQEGVAPIAVRDVATCHYFTGVSLVYAVVPARQRQWCRPWCKPSAGETVFRGLMRPGYTVAQRPFCKAAS